MSGSLAQIAFRIPSALSISSRSTFSRPTTLLQRPVAVLLDNASRNYAARKGTQERKRKIAVANRTAKLNKLAAMGPLQTDKMKKMKALQQKPLFPDQSTKPVAVDNVFSSGMYQWTRHDLETAIKNFVEVHSPTMFDNPKALIKAYFELDLRTKKKTKFLDNIVGVVELPHFFDTGKPTRTVCLFCKDADLNAKALEATAELAIGVEGVKMFQGGDLDPEDYDVFVAHPDILLDLVPIRGLISKKFPNINKGTVGFDVVSLINKFKKGVDYKMVVNSTNPQVGFVEIPIGLADMSIQMMVKNYVAVMEVLSAERPPGLNHQFITLGGVTSQYSHERFLVNLEIYQAESEAEDGSDGEDDSKSQTKVAQAQ